MYYTHKMILKAEQNEDRINFIDVCFSCTTILYWFIHRRKSLLIKNSF